MKYALLMVGQPRTMEFCFPSLKHHILDVYEPDVFLVSDAEEERLKELFNPRLIDIRCQDEINVEVAELRSRYKSNVPGDGLVEKDLSVAWKLWRANRMKREIETIYSFRYDTVIITRFDVKFRKVPPIGKAAEQTIYVPYVGAYWDTPPDEPGIHWHGYSAHLCWMSSEVADLVAGIYFEGEDNFALARDVAPWGYIPEHVLKHTLDRNGVRAELFEAQMMLIRGTNENPLSYHGQPLSKYPEYMS